MKLLSRLGLGGKHESFPHQLSGGQMQRVSIARALAGGQPLLLCDEPTGNLSQKAGLEVMQLLRKVCDEDGKTVVLVTHNPRDATFADRVLFLVDGALDPANELCGRGWRWSRFTRRSRRCTSGARRVRSDGPRDAGDRGAKHATNLDSDGRAVRSAGAAARRAGEA